ncbi:MAG: DNA methyltransferase [Robiginitomaculum sp.]|nr:MAG: DNA methyltransferase [Robiginitomaculum sp.]
MHYDNEREVDKNKTKKYKIIYCDPPWQYNDKSLNRGGAERHYKTTANNELCNIDVQSVCDDDCIIFMWATFPKIKEALELMGLWGFEYKTNAFTWVKKNKIKDSWFCGMGRWTRSNAEICLLGVKGKPKRIGIGVHSVIDAKIMKHSTKPQEARDKILELMGDLPRLEMFARDSADGWDVFGDEAPNSITIDNKG